MAFSSTAPRAPITFWTREELERELGAPDELLPGMDTTDMLRAWAGYVIGEAGAAIMTVPQLTNLYHERMSVRPADPNAIVLQTLDTIYRTDVVRAIIREELENLAPRRIEVSSPAGIAHLPATVHYRTELVLRIVGLGHNVMLVGPAGCGKTTIGEFVAQALNLPCYITSTINDTHELTGFIDGHGRYHRTPFRQAFEFGGIWIADEIDAWDAGALLAANSALANGFCVFPDIHDPVRRHANFRFVGTANTFGSGADRLYVGRNELDAASLDRFATIDVDYDLTLERLFANGQDRWLERVWDVRKAVHAKKIRHVVSSRAIGMGSAALTAGIPWDVCEEIYLFKGLSASDRSKIDG